MRFSRNLLAPLALLVFALPATPALSQATTSITITTAKTGNTPINGNVCFTAVDQNHNPIPVTTAGGGYYDQGGPFCQQLTSGALAGILPVPNPATDSATGHGYKMVICDDSIGCSAPQFIRTISGSTWSLDTYIPPVNLQNATVGAGTTTTLPPGSAASCSVTGSAPNFALNCGVPQGEPGLTGATGLSGNASTQGDANSYAQSYWSNLNDFTVQGAAPTITNGALAFATSASNWDSSSLTLNSPVSSDDSADMMIDFTYGTGAAASTTTCNVAIGKVGINPAGFSVSAAFCGAGQLQQLDLLTTFSGSIGGLVNPPWIVPFTAAVGDEMEFYFSQRGATYQVTLVDVTQELAYTNSYTFYMLATAGVPIVSNTSQWKISGLSPGITVNRIKITSVQAFEPNIVIAGDSKSQYSSIAAGLRYSELIKPTLGPVDNLSGPGDTTAALLADVPYILAKKPTYIILNMCRNDLVASGGSYVLPSQSQANYQSIVSQFQAAGVNVIHLLPLPETTIPDQSACTNFINATYPSAQKIDVTSTIYGAAWNNSVDLSADGTHPSGPGQALIAHDIAASGFIAPRASGTYNDFKPWPFIPWQRVESTKHFNSTEAVTDLALVSSLDPNIPVNGYLGWCIGLSIATGNCAGLSFRNNGGPTANALFLNLYGLPGLILYGNGTGALGNLEFGSSSPVAGVASLGLSSIDQTNVANFGILFAAGFTVVNAPAGGILARSIGNTQYETMTSTGETYTIPVSAPAFVGPPTAPTGSCSTNGQWVLSQDGHVTLCSAGTWTTKI